MWIFVFVYTRLSACVIFSSTMDIFTGYIFVMYIFKGCELCCELPPNVPYKNIDGYSPNRDVVRGKLGFL